MKGNWEYRVVVYREGFLGSVIFGASKVDPEKFTAFLNRHGAQGWEVITMERDIRRQFLFFKVDSYAVIMKRPQQTEDINVAS